MDTSFLATDNLNNPSKMNPIFAIPARLTVAHEEDITGGALNFPGEQSQHGGAARAERRRGFRSGIIGALSRVYVSIGEFSQQWLRDHNVIVGGTPQRPFSVANAQKNSVYFQATAERMPNLAKFLMKMNGPRLAGRSGRKSIPHAG